MIRLVIMKKVMIMKLVEMLNTDRQEVERKYEDPIPHDVPETWSKGQF